MLLILYASEYSVRTHSYLWLTVIHARNKIFRIICSKIFKTNSSAVSKMVVGLCIIMDDTLRHRQRKLWL